MMQDGYYYCSNRKTYNPAGDWEFIGLLKTDEFDKQWLYLPGIEEQIEQEDFIFDTLKLSLKVK
jgi:hypothetical protein